MRSIIELDKASNSCFVVMPFGPKFDLIYEEVFKPAIETTGLSCVRADEIFGSKRIMQDVWNSIRSARVILAELSGRNPNVLYELGLSHAIGKPVVIVTSSMEDVPFDLKDLRCIVYEKDHPRWGDALKQNISQSIKSTIAESPENQLLSHIMIEGNYPEVPKSPTQIKRAAPVFNVTGEWLCKEKWPGLNIDRETRFYLTQQDKNITGVALTQRPGIRSSMTMIIKQTVSGRIDNNVLNLISTSYEIVSGEPEKWHLESWQAFIDDTESMTGKVTDDHGNHGECSINRVLDVNIDDNSV